DRYFTKAIKRTQPKWRLVVSTAIKFGVPVPAFCASLAYYDSYRSARLPANLLQAQRDFFGAHTYERVDKLGVFHTDWLGSEGEPAEKPTAPKTPEPHHAGEQAFFDQHAIGLRKTPKAAPIAFSWERSGRRCRELQTGSQVSPELKLLPKHDTSRKRTNWPISPVDSFFSYDFRAPLCSCCADRGCKRVAIAENSFASDRVYGVRADGSNALQPAR